MPVKRTDNFAKEKHEKLLLELDKIKNLLAARDLELEKLKKELLEKINQPQSNEEKLKEMNNIMEIKLKARTRELRENIMNLDEQVKERTKKMENSQIALMNILDDFRQQKRKTEEEHKKNMAIVDNFSDGLLIFDENNLLHDINKKAEEFFKILKEDYIGKSINELASDPSFKLLLDVIGADIQDTFRKGFKLNDMVLEVTAASISGNKYGKFIILHDSTRENKIQSLKSEFVSIVAHQLRTPLSAIKWTLTSMLDGDFGEFNEEQNKYLKRTNFSNERMINLVDDLLNLSRIEEGRYIYKNAPVRVADLLQSAADDVEVRAKGKNIKLDIKAMEKLPEVVVDQEKIRLVIQNFLDNAINYSPAGGKVYISVEDNPSKKEVLFTIRDEGIGIPKEQQDRIFTKFFRAENALRAETVGSGLGLFINKNIIEAHGGRVWFESKRKKGTIFYFTLPYGNKAK